MNIKSLVFALPLLALSVLQSFAENSQTNSYVEMAIPCSGAATMSKLLRNTGFEFLGIMPSKDHTQQFELLINPKANKVILVKYDVNENGDPTSKACVIFYASGLQVDQNALNTVYNKYAKNPN